jgi:hypothetical protein
MTGAVPDVPTSWRPVGAVPTVNGPDAAVLFRHHCPKSAVGYGSGAVCPAGLAMCVSPKIQNVSVPPAFVKLAL